MEIIPHAGGLQPWALHLISAQINCPLAEWVVIGNPGEENPLRPLYPYLQGAPVPENGTVRPSNRPGIGVSVDPRYLAP